LPVLHLALAQNEEEEEEEEEEEINPIYRSVAMFDENLPTYRFQQSSENP
jgi:hypothetical protein